MNDSPNSPYVRLSHLDQLWFQVAGTLCNLTCHHCFISCSPKNDTFGQLTLSQVRDHLSQSVALGVKEYYFTGGEPFLNRDLVTMLTETLQYGPATVLTNGTVLRDQWLRDLQAADRQSEYSLEFRVSIDGFTAAMNDPIRGEGTFERAVEGVLRLVAFDFLPIITVARTWSIEQEAEIIESFSRMLRARGYGRPRLKVLPTLRMGAEVNRTHGYRDGERVTPQMLEDFDMSQLVCEHSRMVTDRGVHVCPILIESPDSWLGNSLHDALGPFVLRHAACFTCYQYGAICSNPASMSAPRGQA